MSAVNHENVLQVLAVAVDPNTNRLAILMPLMETNVGKAIADGLLVSGQIRLSCAFQAAQGLEALHGNNILHRNVKSTNLLASRIPGTDQFASAGQNLALQGTFMTSKQSKRLSGLMR
jgi:serine/threonine protein kinase